VRLHDLLDGLDVSERRGVLDVDVRSVVHDSRDVRPGALFACVPGAVTDGHAHAAAAVDAGAVALLVERILPLEVPQARVASVRRVLGPVAARFHGTPSEAMRVIGVTGTNGKTTTTYLLDAIGRAHGERTGVVGTVGTRIGEHELPPGRTTPEATDLQALLATMRGAGVRLVAIEVSSHALDQHRVDGTRFASVAFTNLSHEHLDYHGTMEAYFEAKARLFDTAFAPAAAVALDDAHGAALYGRARRAGLDTWSFSARDRGADVLARDARFGRDGTTFVLESSRDGLSVPVALSLVGPYNVQNALAAAAAALAAGIPFAAVVDGLSAPVVVPGRLERVDAGQGFTVLVDYAHTPDALARVLDAARVLAGAGGAVALVFGCGGDRDRSKRPLMGEVAARLADRAYLTSDNPRSEEPAAIAADVLAGAPADRPPVVELDRRAAIRLALREAAPGDVVVIAGKGHEPGQTASGVTVPFDDRVVAREELGGLACR
jgi:UDP-N-acetylmuramoyl-L-alanyl-D-glutamate--2,6-diaminopimelate ligase